VGIDTDASALREASARAARPAHKGGLPNVLFLAGDARRLPETFEGRVDDLRIVLPWGSLLRAVLAAEPELVDLVCRSLRPDGEARVVVSVMPADEQAIGLPASLGRLEALARASAAAGLDVSPPRPFEPADALQLRSSWAKRLGVPARRPATLLRVRRGPGDRPAVWAA
jgi:hypothetical protein